MVGRVIQKAVSDSRLGRRPGRELRVTAWLGAGALGVGVGVAVLGGASVAQADTGNTSGTSHGVRTTTARPATSGRTSHSPQIAARSASSVRQSPHGAGAVASPAAAVPRRSVALAPTVAFSYPVPNQLRGASSSAVASTVASATGSAWHPGKYLGDFVAVFISNGTMTHPNAGLLIGNGFSYDSTTCPVGSMCDGGNGGILFGDGGNGWNGGNGGKAWLSGDGGNGGDALGAFAPPNTVAGNGYVDGGDGGDGGLLFGNGGSGGAASTNATGGDGGRGGLFFGVGGMGGFGGPGAVTCSDQESTCTVFADGGSAGNGGKGGPIGGVDGMDGYQTLPLSSDLYDGYTLSSNSLQPWTNTVPGYLPPPYVVPITYETAILENGLANPAYGYPNPYFVPDTTSSVRLAAGTPVAAWLDEFGNFLAPTGTPFAELSIPPYVALEPYVTYVVKNPAALPAGWWIERSVVSPGFGQPGGGIQYAIYASPDKSVPGSISVLLASGYLAYAPYP